MATSKETTPIRFDALDYSEAMLDVFSMLYRETPRIELVNRYNKLSQRTRGILAQYRTSMLDRQGALAGAFYNGTTVGFMLIESMWPTLFSDEAIANQLLTMMRPVENSVLPTVDKYAVFDAAYDGYEAVASIENLNKYYLHDLYKECGISNHASVTNFLFGMGLIVECGQRACKTRNDNDQREELRKIVDKLHDTQIDWDGELYSLPDEQT